MKTNKEKPFNVGDLVTSEFNGKRHIIRKITQCDRDKSCGSGWRASADGGEICHCCGRVESHIIGIDADWFEKVVEK